MERGGLNCRGWVGGDGGGGRITLPLCRGALAHRIGASLNKRVPCFIKVLATNARFTVGSWTSCIGLALSIASTRSNGVALASSAGGPALVVNAIGACPLRKRPALASMRIVSLPDII